jgi:hypothetical protein
MHIAYVYSPQGSLITQIHGLSEVEVSEKLNDSSSASFVIEWNNPANTLSALQEFYRVFLYKQDSNGEEHFLFQ